MTLLQIFALAFFIVGCVFMVMSPGNLQSPSNWFLLVLALLAIFAGFAPLGGKIL